MEATPQQVSAGSLYSYKTRLGNWQEEIAIGEAKLSSFRQRSETGNLSLRKQEVKLERCNEIVPLSYSSDGTIRFGDNIILQQDATGALLACDPFETIIQNSEQYLVTGSEQSIASRARQVFTVLPPPSNLQDPMYDYSDPVLKFGQSFCLGCNESMLVNTNADVLNSQLYLCSTKKTERMCTKTTNRQLVYLSPLLDGNAVWQLIIPSKGRKNSSERFLSTGQPVLASEVLQLQHRQTNMLLLCDSNMKMVSEFGIELECYADRTALNGKLSLMASEMSGQSTPLTLQKPDDPLYSWKIIVSNDMNQAVDTRTLPPKATYEKILMIMKSKIVSFGVDGFWSLRSYLSSLTSKTLGTYVFDCEDLKSALKKWGLTIDESHINTVLSEMDESSKGVLDWRVFLEVLRGALPMTREDTIRRIFIDIEKDKKGFLTPSDCLLYFNAEAHPVNVSAADAIKQIFQSVGDGSYRKDSKLNCDQFVHYYADLSACIDDDEYFTAIVTKSWNN